MTHSRYSRVQLAKLSDALTTYVGGMDSTTARRGAEYAVNGAVLEISELETQFIEAIVAGSNRHLYELVLYLDEPTADGDCACPVGTNCKHCYAVAIRLLAELHASGIHGKEACAHLLPNNWPAALPEDLPPIRGVGYELLLASIEKAQAQSGSAPVRRKTAQWWQVFLEAADEGEANAALMKGFRERLPRISAGYYRYPAPTFTLNDNRVDVLIQHDLVVQQAAAYFGMRPKEKDPALVAWMSSPEAKALWELDQERAVRARLLDWLKAKAPAPQASSGKLEFQWFIRNDDPTALPELSFRILLTTQKLRSSPRSAQAADALLREHLTGKRTIPIGQAKLLAWLLERHVLWKAYDTPSEFPVRHVREWFAQADESVFLTWEAGEAIRLDLQPARLTLTMSAGKPAWAVRLPATNPPVYALLASQQIVSEGIVPGSEDEDNEVFILLDGKLHPLDAAGMPIQVLQWLVRRPELPMDALQETPEAAHLLDLFLPYADSETATALVSEIPVRCWLEFRKESKKGLLITARARSEDNNDFVFGADGIWRQIQSVQELPHDYEDLGEVEGASWDAGIPADPALAPSAHALVERPRRQDTAAMEAWLGEFPGGFLPGPPSLPLPALRWLMPPDGLSGFLAWWIRRPGDLACYADKAFRAMLQARETPRYKVSIRASGKNWLEVSVAMEEEVQGLSLEEAARLLETAQGDLVLMRGGGYYRRKDLEDYREQAEALAELGLAVESGEQRVHAFQLAGASLDRLTRTAEADAQWLALRAEMTAALADFQGIPQARLDKALLTILRPYQRAGVDFLVWACQTFGGAVLADDMGLGKTLQVLAAITGLREKKPKPSLVVCPASVSHNWQREAARFTPSLKTVVLEAGSERQEVLDRLGEYDLVIKNYSLARRDAEKLQAQEWLLVCVDEAQAIKNPAAAITATVKSLTPQYRIALTGTPIENRLQDLWSIVDFAVPGYLPPLDKINALDKSSAGGIGYKTLRARLRPVLLRRMKAEVAPELPPRIEERLDCAMTSGQRKAYLAELKQARALLQSTGNVVGKERIQILAALTRLRQLCCEPELRGVRGTGSGKVDVLMEQLPVVLEAGHKVLVFSQFVQMIKILERRFTKEGIPFYTLTGATTKRPELIQRFEEDERPCVFLISLKAGGTGLNLTSATHVFLFDPWWNPAVEAQAIDRTHRIGQDKTVVAFRLVTEGTIEERILELQEEKRGLVKNVLEDEAFNRMLTKDDFKYLLE